jgi:hypothetical protein
MSELAIATVAVMTFQLIAHSAFAGVTACLISESKLFAPIRNYLQWDVLYCPICLGFWLAAPALLEHGFHQYFLVVGLSNVWMLIILKVYRELDLTADEAEDETPEKESE